MIAHAKYGPSGAHRWMVCPGSIALPSGVDDKPSPSAEEGTLAHELAEILLKAWKNEPELYVLLIRVISDDYPDGMSPEDLPENIKELLNSLGKDNIEHVLRYVDRVTELSMGGDLLIEQTVDYGMAIGLPKSAGRQFGTADAIIIPKGGKELIIADLKFGRGVEVDAEDNPALMLYALGALDVLNVAYGFEAVRLIIDQPRISAPKHWTTTPEDLMAFAAKAKKAIILAEKAGKELSFSGLTKEWIDSRLFPGEKQCKFCRASGICPKLAETAVEVLGCFDLDDLDSLPEEPQSTKEINATKLGQLLHLAPLIEIAISAWRKRAFEELSKGEEVPGWKLVLGREGNRKWSDEKTVETALEKLQIPESESHDLVLRSPTQLEKQFKKTKEIWEILQEMIVRNSGQSVLAPESDKRPAIKADDPIAKL